MPWSVQSDPSTRPKFLEAIEWLRRRVPISDTAYSRLVIAAHDVAIRLAGVTQLDVVEDVRRSLERAVSQGESFTDWKRKIRRRLTNAWVANDAAPANPGWRIETIFRTNVQRAYSAGRYEQITDPVVVESRPFWMYDALLDDRTTEFCREMNGTILPANDARWDGRIPPTHFNCRSGLRTLRESQARRRGISSSVPDDYAQEGFGGVPAPHEPDPARYPPELWAAYEERVRAREDS
jgi:SPP1 gp7 family putative phage head morphogenesis protein